MTDPIRTDFDVGAISALAPLDLGVAKKHRVDDTRFVFA
jgi:hypothetical protein